MVISLPLDFFIVGVTCSPTAKLTQCKIDKKMVWNRPNVHSVWVFSMPFMKTEQSCFRMQKYYLLFSSVFEAKDTYYIYLECLNKKNYTVNFIGRSILIFKLNLVRHKRFVCFENSKLLKNTLFFIYGCLLFFFPPWNLEHFVLIKRSITVLKMQLDILAGLKRMET